MQEVLRECLRAGAIGMSTSFVDLDEHGRLTALLTENGERIECGSVAENSTL